MITDLKPNEVILVGTNTKGIQLNLLKINLDFYQEFLKDSVGNAMVLSPKT